MQEIQSPCAWDATESWREEENNNLLNVDRKDRQEIDKYINDRIEGIKELRKNR